MSYCNFLCLVWLISLGGLFFSARKQEESRYGGEGLGEGEGGETAIGM